nr:hypothetical protein [Tanacetum cinerariifolium]
MSSEDIEELIAQRVTDALASYEANRNTVNGNGNRSGSQSDGGSGTKGDVGLARWFEKMDYMFDEMMKLMTEAYFPRNEIHTLEGELWNMMVKGTNVVGYTQRFQELALLCQRMVPEEEDKVERLESTLRENNVQQPPFKRHKVARAYTVAPNDRKVYVAGKLSLCNRCKLHHNGQCTVMCINFKRIGHMTRDCSSSIVATGQRAPVANQKTLTCFKCWKQGDYRSECPELKNQNHGNQTGSSEACGRVYALGGREADQDHNNIVDNADA